MSDHSGTLCIKRLSLWGKRKNKCMLEIPNNAGNFSFFYKTNEKVCFGWCIFGILGQEPSEKSFLELDICFFLRLWMSLGCFNNSLLE